METYPKNHKKAPPMANPSSFISPLCEKISYKSYVLRAMDLTTLGLLFSLLVYRILHISQNDTAWVVAFFCESYYTFVCLLITSTKWSPVNHKTYPDRLDERVMHDLPSVDMFVTTADPVREPPIIVVNTVLSLLAMNYPVNKLACYVSDDGCSPITYFSLKEASRFAKIWVPFCKKYNVKVTAPFRYFLNPIAAVEDSEFAKEWEMTKREYEKLRHKLEDTTGDCHLLNANDDFVDFSNTDPNDHSTIVKVIWENNGSVGDKKEVPHLVYISREKRPNRDHHYKAGAMNFLVRVSGLMTNAPYMLNVDCDMYVNEANAVRQAMCIFFQESMNHNECAFVQFLQDFNHLEQGIGGIQGPMYVGSGCFHTRRVMYGLSPDDLEDDGSLSSVATREILTEESLTREFGTSKEMVKSVVESLQIKSNLQNSLTNSLEAAKEVGNLHYEDQTSWGKTIGWLYDSITEDINTSIGIHSRGWTSSCICLDRPAFLGCMPLQGLEAMIQRRRWTTGALEILFNKQSPLRGIFHHKLLLRQRLAYLSVSMNGLTSIPYLFYSLLPAYCLLHNSPLFPKGLCLGIILTLVGMHCLYTLWKFLKHGFSVLEWYLDFCGSLYSVFDITLKLLGISKTVFIVTKKTMHDTKPEYGDVPCHPDGLNPDSSKYEIEGSLLFLPSTFILLVNLAALVDYLVGVQVWSRNDKGGASGLEEVCGCMFVAMLFVPFLKDLFENWRYRIPWSTLSKAVFLAILFVAFSVRN